MRQSVEILAPVGSPEGLDYALRADCDAVYVGGSLFGARASAKNLDQEQMIQAIRQMHYHDKKLYITVNTLLYQEELDTMLYEFMAPLYEAGLDAAIVQDTGVLTALHQWFPELDLHASTQMTMQSGHAANLLKPYGVTRIVPARELSIQQIRACREQTDLELEVFVHGALCYCYSGQCLLSEEIGGRSGNRGRCAQPCRLPYEVNGKRGFILSPKDVCTITRIPDLVDAGIDSFKIEGRMKRKEYAALTSILYKRYVTFYKQEGREEFQKAVDNPHHPIHKDVKHAMDIYNRGGFCKGYLFEKDKSQVMYPKKNNHFGLLVGEIVDVKGNRCRIRFCEDVAYQDVLEFRETDDTKAYEYTVKNPATPGDICMANFMKGSHVFPGQKVYRTKNASLLEAMEMLPPRDIQVTGRFVGKIGEKASLTIANELAQVTAKGHVIEAASNRPVTREDVESRLQRMGESEFSWDELEVTMDDGAFIPLGKVNELRREALELWKETVDAKFGRRADGKTVLDQSKREVMSEILVSVSTKEQLSVVLKSQAPAICMQMDSISKKDYGEIAKRLREFPGKKYMEFPLIILEKDIPSFDDEEIEYVVNSWESLLYVMKRRDTFLLDSNMYTVNDTAKSFYEKMGAVPVGKIAYGRKRLMTTKGCVRRTIGQCNKGNSGGSLVICNDNGDEFIVVNHCENCYNTLYTITPVMDQDGTRLIFTTEDEKEVRRVLNTWKI